ncbi:uncharacterized protein LOC143565351 [Bidens hawaiensis]|uniref:uncharacterized protein LOC143565351 n=1 Tax=Bidens hawaiensis TaxID=980011 RepID=UPI00404B1055
MVGEKLKEESENLKKQNEDLSKEIERLQADRCADVEELVYLRWINACLRYELRNYQPGPGKTTAKDLSKNLSPKSEHKAKQLILEYANKEDGGESLINLQEIDSYQWSRSNSQASINMDSSEFDESFTDDWLPHKNNKFFGKLMRILRGKDKDKDRDKENHRRIHSRGRSESGGDDVNSCWSPDNQRSRMSTGGSKKLRHRHSDSSFYNTDPIVKDDVCGGSGSGGCRSRSSSMGGQKSELVKYAEALKDSHRRSPSLMFF